MIHVWLCDDETIFLEQAAAYVRDIFAAKQIDVSLRTFCSAESLLAALNNASPDLLLLDLILNEHNGYDIAETVCQRALSTELVFITNYPDSMNQAFAYRPIGFLQKPITPVTLLPILDRFLFFFGQKNKTLTITTRSQVIHVLLKDILYIESSSHKLHLYAASQAEPIVFTGKLDDIESFLAHSHFVRCHKSFLVNTLKITAIDKSRMLLSLPDGQTLPVSRRCHAAVANKFSEDNMR